MRTWQSEFIDCAVYAKLAQRVTQLCSTLLLKLNTEIELNTELYANSSQTALGTRGPHGANGARTHCGCGLPGNTSHGSSIRLAPIVPAGATLARAPHLRNTYVLLVSANLRCFAKHNVQPKVFGCCRFDMHTAHSAASHGRGPPRQQPRYNSYDAMRARGTCPMLTGMLVDEPYGDVIVLSTSMQSMESRAMGPHRKALQHHHL